METGRSTRCKSCASRERGQFVATSQVDHALRKRVNDWFQRCGNPQSHSWRNYGARGIECRFASVKEAVEWVKTNLPHATYSKLDIDRIDNDGHYEPGNLRLVSRAENLRNRRHNNTLVWRGETILACDWKESPYGVTPTMRFAAMGMTCEQIIAQAQKAVSEKRKNWRGIEAKLLSMTS